VCDIIADISIFVTSTVNCRMKELHAEQGRITSLVARTETQSCTLIANNLDRVKTLVGGRKVRQLFKIFG